MKNYFVLFILFWSIQASAQSWTKQYDFVDDCVCGLAKVSKDGKFGYVTKSGELVVPLVYDEALTFSEGRAGVRKGNKWGYLDSTGKVVVEPMYEEVSSFHDSIACVKKK